MAYFLNKTHLLSHLRSNPQKIDNLFAQRSRAYHIDLGQREKALLAADPALSKFKSYKQGVKRIKRIGDIVTIIAAAGCGYELYVRATMRKEAMKKAESA